ncbi:hypothetical protein AGMMS49950_01030 [Endomicrobiia bacterium]|nr:hypothetical protein AGMMS49531_01940 [Endomicrobiia bacterium]GHT63752.1 hypothetical protein AGMMS49556_00730 [Endomicrobiia bacterium]GHT69061.1 hypothetical protein AGMMS49950_01030 [Endomicrobiia bacterium]
MSKEKIEYREYCKDDVLSTLGQYPNILSLETATMSAKVVDIDHRVCTRSINEMIIVENIKVFVKRFKIV